MDPQAVADIPRFYTAIAEWLACLTVVAPGKLRVSRRLWCLLEGIFLGLLLITNLIGEHKEQGLWLVWMGLGLLVMFLSVYLCVEQTVWQSLYAWALAFLLAEFAASLEWQVSAFIRSVFPSGYPPPPGMGCL